MPLTSRQILKLLETPYANGKVLGQIEGMRRSLGNGFSRDGDLLKATAATIPPRTTPVVYDNPLREIGVPRTDPLSPADIAWLQRLPSNPEEISYADARLLSSMAAGMKRSSSDGRLVWSVYEPVRRLHQGRDAHAQLERVRKATPLTVPAGLQELLVQAILRENPDLSPVEASNRAAEWTQAARAKAQLERDHDLDVAQAAADLAAEEFTAEKIAGNPEYERQARQAAGFGHHGARAALWEHEGYEPGQRPAADSSASSAALSHQ